METAGGGGEGEGSSAAVASESRSAAEMGKEPEEADQVGPGTPVGLTRREYEELRPTIEAYHTYSAVEGQCSSLLSQRVRAPAAAVWSVVRRFDRPQVYKHFIRSCALKGGGEIRVGCLREVSVISGLPASTSTERLDVLDEERHVFGFSIIGGEHRLRNYRSVTTVNEFGRRAADRRGDEDDDEIWSVVLESYVVDVPEGNTEEDTRLFADTVVRLNLQKMASVAEVIARGGGGERWEQHQQKKKNKRGGGGEGGK